MNKIKKVKILYLKMKNRKSKDLLNYQENKIEEKEDVGVLQKEV